MKLYRFEGRAIARDAGEALAALAAAAEVASREFDPDRSETAGEHPAYVQTLTIEPVREGD